MYEIEILENFYRRRSPTQLRSTPTEKAVDASKEDGRWWVYMTWTVLLAHPDFGVTIYECGIFATIEFADDYCSFRLRNNTEVPDMAESRPSFDIGKHERQSPGRRRFPQIEPPGASSRFLWISSAEVTETAKGAPVIDRRSLTDYSPHVRC